MDMITSMSTSLFPDEDAELRRQIDDDVGVDVDRAAAGHRVRKRDMKG